MTTGSRSIMCDKKSFNQMHREYYEAMGWGENGVPQKETLKDLKLMAVLKNSISRLK